MWTTTAAVHGGGVCPHHLCTTTGSDDAWSTPGYLSTNPGSTDAWGHVLSTMEPMTLVSLCMVLVSISLLRVVGATITSTSGHGSMIHTLASVVSFTMLLSIVMDTDQLHVCQY